MSGEICSVCKARGKCSRCARCRVTWYCGKNCQTKDWPQHKTYCMPALKTTNITSEIMAHLNKDRTWMNIIGTILWRFCGENANIPTPLICLIEFEGALEDHKYSFFIQETTVEMSTYPGRLQICIYTPHDNVA
jgi:hypothetical protein